MAGTIKTSIDIDLGKSIQNVNKMRDALSATGGVMSKISASGDKVGRALDEVTKSLNDVSKDGAGKLAQGLGNVIGVISLIAKKLRNELVFRGLNIALSSAKNVYSIMRSILMLPINNVGKAFQSASDKANSSSFSAFSSLGGSGSGIAGTLSSGISAFGKGLTTMLSTVVGAIGYTISDLLGGAISKVGGAISKFGEFLENFSLSGIGEKLLNGLKGSFDKLSGWANGLKDSFKGINFKGLFDGLSFKNFGSLLKDFGNSIQNFGESVRNFGYKVTDFIVKGITKIGSLATGALASVPNAIEKVATFALDQAQGSVSWNKHARIHNTSGTKMEALSLAGKKNDFDFIGMLQNFSKLITSPDGQAIFAGMNLGLNGGDVNQLRNGDRIDGLWKVLNLMNKKMQEARGQEAYNGMNEDAIYHALGFDQILDFQEMKALSSVLGESNKDFIKFQRNLGKNTRLFEKLEKAGFDFNQSIENIKNRIVTLAAPAVTSGVQALETKFNEIAKELGNNKTIENLVRKLTDGVMRLIDWFMKTDIEELLNKIADVFLKVGAGLVNALSWLPTVNKKEMKNIADSMLGMTSESRANRIQLALAKATGLGVGEEQILSRGSFVNGKGSFNLGSANLDRLNAVKNLSMNAKEIDKWIATHGAKLTAGNATNTVMGYRRTAPDKVVFYVKDEKGNILNEMEAQIRK